MKRLSLIVALILTCGFAGCATYGPSVGPQTHVNEAGLDYPQVVAMLGEKQPQADIIGQIRARGMRVAPTSADLDALRAGGATEELIDAVLIATWQPSTVAQPGYGYGYGYGPGYYSAYPYYYGPGFGYYYGGRRGGYGGYGGGHSGHYRGGSSFSLPRPALPTPSSPFRGLPRPPGLGGGFRRR